MRPYLLHVFVLIKRTKRHKSVKNLKFLEGIKIIRVVDFPCYRIHPSAGQLKVGCYQSFAVKKGGREVVEDRIRTR